MNFIANESAQKLRGGFYTEPDIASFLVRWVMQGRPSSILEPSCGDGAFVEAAMRENAGSLGRVFGCEMDPQEAAKTRERVPSSKRFHVEIHAGDFLKWFLFRSQEGGKFDAVVGNPPFIRYQYLPEEQQFLSEKIFGRFGLPFTKHTNAWVPFVIASLGTSTGQWGLTKEMNMIFWVKSDFYEGESHCCFSPASESANSISLSLPASKSAMV
jgi:adenine-specific DNA-methyltransferase